MRPTSLSTVSDVIRRATLGSGLSSFAVLVGLIAMLAITIELTDVVAYHLIEATLWVCTAFFAAEWVMHLRNAPQPLAYAISLRGLIDITSVLAVPLALLGGIDEKSAWLFGVIWLLKPISHFPGLRQLRRVIAVESGPLLSVLLLFLMMLMFASVAEYVLEREAQPTAFGSVPAAMWWAVATLTSTGYGDVVPITPAGRLVASLVMISGLAVFGLGIGILATGFAAETRRDNFLKTWESVSRVPFFANLGPAAIADVTHMLRTMDLPARTTIIRRGQTGECMYFLAEGEVEVYLPGKTIKLSEGAFFGEMALLGNSLRSADIVTTKLSKLLVLDLVDFRMLMARHSDLASTIDTEAKRRAIENS